MILLCWFYSRLVPFDWKWSFRLRWSDSENIDKVPVCHITSDFGTEGFHGAPITKVQPPPSPSQAL